MTENSQVYFLQKFYTGNQKNFSPEKKTILFLHGYRDNFVESGILPKITQRFSQYQIIFLTFRNHLKRYLGNTFYPSLSERVEDLQNALAEIKSDLGIPEANLNIFAYSQGASVFLKYLSTFGLKNEMHAFKKIVLVSPRVFLGSFLQRFTPENIEELKFSSSTTLSDGVKIGKNFFAEIQEDKLKKEVLFVRNKLHVTWGERDNVVSAEEIEYLKKNLNVTLHIEKDADHLLRSEYLDFITKLF